MMFTTTLKKEDVPLNFNYRDPNRLLEQCRHELHWKFINALLTAEHLGFRRKDVKIEPDPDNDLIHLVWR